MKTIILNKIKEIELEKGVEILYAVESGSRAWGFSSPDSDYDIRFIYKNNANHYLSLWENTDTIEFMTSDNLDGSGWDIKKTLLLLSKSNSPLLEWLYSPIIYYEKPEIIDELRSLAKECFSPISCMYHYIGTTKNFMEICEQEKVKLKSYFYALRTVLAGKWIIEQNSFPPVDFLNLLPIAPKEIQDKVHELLYIKANQNEGYLHPKEEMITDFIKKTLEYNQQKATNLKSGTKINDDLDNFFRKIILK